MIRRVQGRVKQAQKRAQKRRDIRAGRIISMQEYIRRTQEANHQHTHEASTVEQPVAETQQVPTEPNGTHQLVRKDNGAVIGQGTEYQMRKLREQCMAETPDVVYSVRKVKAAA
jgi:hypothetical protein